MAQKVQVEVQSRTEKGKGSVGRLRRSGLVPGVVYGRGFENQMVSVGHDEVKKIEHVHGVIQLRIASGDSHPVLLRAMQRDCLRGTVTHIDFQVIRMDEVINASVAIVSQGDPVGLAQGGVLEQQLHEIEVECLPGNLPEEIVVDVSGLKLNEVVTVADLAMPEGVKVAGHDDETPVFTCAAPHLAEERAEETEAAEPELIEKGKKEEEEAAK